MNKLSRGISNIESDKDKDKEDKSQDEEWKEGDAWENSEEEYDEEETPLDVGPGYELLNLDQIRGAMMETIDELNDMLQMKIGDFLKIARHFNWNRVKIEDNYVFKPEL